MSKYDELVKKLKEIFQIDRPELDFGIYRILNIRVAEVTDYLENKLKARVSQSFADSIAANLDRLETEVNASETRNNNDGNDVEQIAKLTELRARIQNCKNECTENENGVFSHLLTFFSRYYDNGDFISQRRYKGDTYAIPYGGEEVVLHWANKDQYYTKSSENFANYGFKLDDGRNVRFRLISADTDKDNRKDNDKERRFVLLESQTRMVRRFGSEDEDDEILSPVMETGDEKQELIIHFEYKAMPKGTKQELLVQEATQKILADEKVKARWLDLSTREPTEKNPHRTLLEKCLNNYTSKNTADYFIHKNLDQFLKRELDFYIKNELMHLDDLQTAETFSDIEKNLRLIQTFRGIALELISFLAHLENFQKRLWLKKKFVVSAEYCITLDRLPESVYPSIISNDNQWQSWKELGIISEDPRLSKDIKDATINYLKSHPYLMIDTSLFDISFKAEVLSSIEKIDDSLDGLLIDSDNFQALNLLKERYREQIKCTYIDPPYNTGGDGFAYKDKYQHSSWASMMEMRLSLAKYYMSTDGVLFCSIDAKERPILECLLNQIWGRENRVEELIWIQNSTKNQSPTYSTNHEYIEVFARNLEIVKSERATFREPKPGYIELMDLVESLNPQYPPARQAELEISRLFELHREQFKTQLEEAGIEFDKNLDQWKGLYPYNRAEYRDEQGKYVADDNAKKSGATLWIWRESDTSMPQVKEDSQKAEFRNKEHPMFRFYEPLHPVTNRPCPPPKRGWAWPYLPQPSQSFSFSQYAEDHRIVWGKDEAKIPQIKRFLHETETNVAKSTINDFTDGEKQLTELFGKTRIFGGPKPTTIIERFILQTTSNGDFVMDFFAGSGTTGHAVININRLNHSRLRYLLIEQGEHLHSIVKPRMQKLAYSAQWKGGKPTAQETGISQAFKVLKIESYEDTLNNLNLRRTRAQQSLLDLLPAAAKDDYLLHYLLDIESRGSILSVEQFNRPFCSNLKITVDSAGAYQERSVDLVETFNYLIGLQIEHIDMRPDKGFTMITGRLQTGEKTLVLWRDTEQLDYEALNQLCNKLAINPADSEFDLVFINGDHNIPSVFTATDAEGGNTRTLKIRQIEREFLDRMFCNEATE